MPETDEQRFQSFVCKLANVCDNVKGGTTVTSFAVLQHEARVLYVFGSNQLSFSSLQKTEEFVTKLLNLVANADDDEESIVHLKKEVLKHIFVFNRLRVQIYVRHLREHVEACLKACQGQNSETGKWLCQ